jgi:hypothetical protein
MEGKLVFNKTFESLHVFNQPFNLTSFSPGIYTMKISEGEQVTRHRLVIQ